MKNVDWKKINETLAISQGQWIDNGYPIVFQLVTMIDDDKMHLIIYPESEQEILNGAEAIDANIVFAELEKKYFG